MVTRKHLYEIAHSRAGDKGDSVNLSLIPFDENLYGVLVEQVTEEAVGDHFCGLVKGEVKRYELPNVAALNFVLSGALAGGVTRSLALDAHGKTLSYHLLSMQIRVSEPTGE